jgi:broad specificity phosphatase PhoE
VTRIFLIRHGQTEWNRREIFRGRVDIPLSPVGIRQAEALARRLAGQPLSAIYCSPLSRAVATARHLPGPPPQAADDLTDMSYGAWEGLSHDEVRSRFPDLYARWLEAPHRVRPPGGETLAEVRQRAVAALTQIAARHRETSVAVVSHRVVNKLLICAALGLGEGGFWRIRQDTGCLNILDSEGDRACVILLNDVCHLRGIEPDASDF